MTITKENCYRALERVGGTVSVESGGEVIVITLNVPQIGIGTRIAFDISDDEKGEFLFAE